MKFNLPGVGPVRTGKDIEVPATVKQSYSLGDLLNLGPKALAGEKTASEKLIKAFYGWVYINVDRIADEVSKFEPELFKTVLKDGELQFVPIEQHPLLDLLDQFNETTTKSEGFYNTEAHLDLTGDAMWYLENGENDRPPESIFLLDPTKVKINFGDFTRTGRLVDSYLYKDTVDGEQQEETYSLDEILHIKVPNPSNQYRGKSTVEAIAHDIDTDTHANAAVRNLFENGMIFNFALTTEQKLTEDQIRKLQQQLKATYAGSKNAYKVPVFGGGLDPKSIQASSKDAEISKQLEWLRDKIMAGFGNTKASLGITDDVNRANAEATLDNWKQSTIKPRMQRIADAVNSYLVPRYGENLILGFKDIVTEDRMAKVTEANALYANGTGLLTRDEARELVGYEEAPEEERPTSDETVEESHLPNSIKNVDWKRHLRKHETFKALKLERIVWRSAKRAAREMVKNKNVKKEDQIVPSKFNNEQVTEYWYRQINITEVNEDRFKNSVHQFVGDIVEATLETLPLKRPKKFKAVEFFDREQMLQRAQERFGPVLRDVALLAGNEAMRMAGVNRPYLPTKDIDMRASIEEQIRKFAISMVDTDVEIMRDILATGLADGLSIPQIRRQIQEKFDTYSKSQAEKVARTEILRTSNTATLDAFEQSGVVEAKQWLTAIDGREDEECAELNGKIVELESTFFKSDYDSGEAPPLHPNCRCVIIPVVVDSN